MRPKNPASLIALCLAWPGAGAQAQTTPLPGALPTGGQVTAGQASISQSGAAMVIQQSSDRAAIAWQQFNVGSGAQVQFQQPSASSVTLNRVLSSDPSQIFGRITANGQVILTNPQGVYFGPSARVDVGGLVASAKSIGDADFMAGKNRYERSGSTGSVVNEGELKAALGGYIALLAPEVRNQGAIIAHMGTVALAAGEAVDLQFDSRNRLTSIRVEPSALQALVDNRHAVQAPGGLIILSAQSMDKLLGGVIKNSGRLEATGLQQQGGRIVLSASRRVENAGSISANALNTGNVPDSGPAGVIEISAPEVSNSGSISAAGAGALSAGSLHVQATQFSQTASGEIDLRAAEASGPGGQGGMLGIQAQGHVQLQGVVNVSAQSASGEGGQIEVLAGGDITVKDAALDASGAQGGRIHLRAASGAQPGNSQPLPEPSDAPNLPDAPGQGRLAVMGNSTLSTRGRSGQAGAVTLLGDQIELFDTTSIDAAGATGGGKVLVGGDWQGSNGVYQATTVHMSQGARIDASATERGDGGTVVLWSDVRDSQSVTRAHGAIYATGGAQGGDGGRIETSGHVLVTEGVTGSAAASQGQAGLWLFDPTNIVISSGGSTNITGDSSASSITASSVSSLLSGGTSVVIQTSDSGGEIGNIEVTSAISKTGNSTATLTLSAHNNIDVQAAIGSSGTGSRLNLALIADSDTNGAGIVLVSDNLTTNGGFLRFGNGTNITLNTQMTQVGGDVYVTGTNALTWSTSGGSVTVNGQMLIGNTHGLSINTGGGAATFNGSIDSANQYDAITYTGTWDQAKIHAESNGGYLATLTTRLENAIASQRVNYQSSWLGGRRVTGLGTNDKWRWVTGPEALLDTHGLIFSTQATTGGASPVGGYFNNWSANEPNNWTGSATGTDQSQEYESVLQFTGDFGAWNDLPNLTYTLSYYVKETTLAASNLTVNAGAGNVNFASTVGVSKELSSLNVTSAGLSASQIRTTSALSINNSAAGSVTSVISGAGSLTKSGTGALTLSGANSYTGSTSINAGSLVVAANAPSGATGALGNASSAILLGNTSGASDAALLIDGSYTLGRAINVQAGHTGTISIGGVGSGSSTFSGAISLGKAATLTAANSGTATFNGVISGANTLTKAGDGSVWLTAANTYTGATVINAGNLVFNNAVPSISTSGFSGSGSLSIQSGGSFSSAFNFDKTTTGLASLTLGSSTNTAAVSISAAQNVSGSVTVSGGAIDVNAALVATGTVTLKATGNVSDGASGYISAPSLLLQGGNVLLDNSSNAVGTLAASGVSGVSYLDSDALTIGTVGSTDGVSASGAVNIGTLTGNLTLNKNVSTSNAATSALVLNAGISSAAGAAAGGDVVLSGGTASVGAGGRATLFTGSLSGSTGVSGFVGTGLGRSRYNADESTDFASGSWTALGSGVYAIYREQPSITAVGVDNKTITYGDALPTWTFTPTGAQNGDSFAQIFSSNPTVLVGGGVSGAGLKPVGAHTLTASGTLSSGLGYAYGGGFVDGTLNVSTKTLTAGYTTTNKVYDAGTTATVSISDNRVAGDVLSMSANAAFVSKDVGTAVTVNVTGAALSGADAGNYVLASTSGSSAANITAKALTIGVPTIADKIYNAATDAGVLTLGELTGFVDTETVSAAGSAAALASANAGDYTTTVSYTLTNGSSGGLASNYSLASTTGVAAKITPKALAITAPSIAAKTYDASTAAGALTIGSLSGFVGSETVTATGSAAALASANTGAYSTAVSYTLTNGSSGGLAANYSLASSTGVAAVISPRLLSLSASKTYDGSTSLTGSMVTLGNLVTGETLSYTGALASSARVSAANKFISAITLADATDGSAGLAGNYALPTLNVGNAPVIISARALTVSAIISGSLSKVYDDTTSASGANVTGSVTGAVAGDVIGLDTSGFTLAYDSARVLQASQIAATGSVGISISSTAGSLASDYSFTAPTVAAVSASITARPLALGLTGLNKVYDGATAAGLTITDDRLSGDQLTVSATAAFADKNVGTGKTINVTGVSLSGSDASNYSVSATGSASANITRLASVTWTGGATGTWLDPANWAGGAVPDLANVAEVVIPSGSLVTLEAAAVAPAVQGSVQVDRIGSAGGLSVTGGTLEVGSGGIALAQVGVSGGTVSSLGAVTVGDFTQSGGSFSTRGTFTASQGFSQGSSGTLSVGGQVQITDSAGGLVLGQISAGSLRVSSLDGAISQAAGTGLSVTGNADFTAAQGGVAADVVLANAGNQFQGTVSASGQDVAITDQDALTLGSITAAGNLTLSSAGALSLGTSTVGGLLRVDSGNADIRQSGPLYVTGSTSLNAGAGNVNLDNSANDFGGAVSATAGSATLVANPSLVLDRISISGAFSATSLSGGLSQVAGSVLSVGGASTLVAATRIELLELGNDLRGGVTSRAASVAIRGDKVALAAASSATAAVTSIALPAAGATAGAGTALASADRSAPGLVLAPAPSVRVDSGSNNSPGIAVSLLRAPSAQAAGLVTVQVPPEIAAAGARLSFALPAAMAAAAAASPEPVQARLADGSALPDWLQFDSATLRFDAAVVPQGAFPLQLLLIVGGEQVLLNLTEAGQRRAP